MEVWKATPPTPANADEVAKLRHIIQRAEADGRLSRQERESIQTAVYADHAVSSEECALMREIQEKIWTGEIQIED